MSFEIYFQRFEAGEKSAFSRAQVEKILAPAMVRQGAGNSCIALVYPSGEAGDLYITDAAEISSFTIVRPGTSELFDDLYALMLEIGAVVYWPDLKPCPVVATQQAEATLPDDMLEVLGPAILVTSGKDIVRAIKRVI